MATQHRIAIAGIGGIAEIHARAIAELPNATLVAGSCRTAAKGKAFAEKWNCQWFAETRQMLDTARPDVLAICTPSGGHLEPALAAFERGVHVLCEKPLEISLQRADAMIAAAERANVALGCIFPQRYNPPVQVIADAIAAGRFGPLSVISVVVPWWRHDEYYSPDRWQGKLAFDGGGALINQGIHAVDLLQWFSAIANPPANRAANPARQIFCYTGRLAHDLPSMEVEDTAAAIVRLHGGTLGQILSATSMYPGSLWRITVAGCDGTAQLFGDQLTDFRFRGELPADEKIRRMHGAATTHHGGTADPLAIPYKNHAANFTEFLEAIDNKTPPRIDGIEARKAVQIVRACYDSAASGQPVELA